VQPVTVPATTDEFDGPRLAPQWQWQANPDPACFSLNRAPGFLRLTAQPLPLSGNLCLAPNLLLQKFPAPEFAAATTLEFTPLAEGDRTGLIVFGDDYAWIGLQQRGGRTELAYAVCHGAARGGAETVIGLKETPAGARLCLRVTVRAGGVCTFAYRIGDADYVPVGKPFTATAGRWVGAKVGLFATGSAGAHADFDWMRFAPLHE
jgi:beta-xylosidase